MLPNFECSHRERALHKKRKERIERDIEGGEGMEKH